MTADLTVVTPAIPERLGMLNQCCASVTAQTLPVRRHLIGVDHARAGIVSVVNALAEAVDTEWMVILADDDLLLKDFVAQMMPAARNPAGVVYSRPVAVGANWAPYRYTFSASDLRKANFIPATALIRTDLWRRLGGYDADAFPEDYDFWLRALDAGAFFRHVPEHNWVYRFHSGTAVAGGNRAAAEAQADPRVGSSRGDAEDEHRRDGVQG